MIRFLLILSVLLCASLSAQAAEGDGFVVPDSFRHKVWAYPDCRYGEMYLLFSDYYFLRIDRGGSHIARPRAAENTDGYIAITDDDGAHFFHFDEESGELAQYFPLRENVSGKEFEDRKNTFAMPFRPCDAPRDDEYWPAADPEGLSLFAALDGVTGACAPPATIAGDAGCRAAVFGAFDGDGDGWLDRTEIESAYRKATWLGAGQSCGFSQVFGVQTAEKASAFADEILTFGDENKDGAVDPAELAAGWDVLSVLPESAAFLSNVLPLYAIMPFLPAHGRHTTCLACMVENGEAPSSSCQSCRN